jgi:hypothetical protein
MQTDGRTTGIVKLIGTYLKFLLIKLTEKKNRKNKQKNGRKNTLLKERIGRQIYRMKEKRER